MRVLLVGNYANSRQQSMHRFAGLLGHILSGESIEVRILHPPAIFGRLKPGNQGLGKLLAYFDRFVLFPLILRKSTHWADLVHICDQANAVYVHWLKNKPHVVTCHDLIAVRSALMEIDEYTPRFSGRIFQRWILASLKKACFLVAVSRQTQDDVLRLVGIDAEHVKIVPNALNYPYGPLDPAASSARLEALGIRTGTLFFLHVGGNQWYKNRNGVLRIFFHLLHEQRFQQYSLIMVGKRWTSSMRRYVNKMGMNCRVVELENVSNRDLQALYSSAQGLIFPSLYEGFGWPIIEAQSCGCPVFTSNRAPMTEVAGEGAVFFDPTNEIQAALSIAQGIDRKDELVAAGYENIKRFSREAMRAGYLDAYEKTMRRYASTCR